MTQILLVEDNRGDILLIRRALAIHAIEHELHVVSNGAEAIEFLEQVGRPGGSACLDLMLLDLNLPKVDGSEILMELRRNQTCAAIPVIVVSSSNAAGDRTRITELGISHYFQKPSDLEEYMQLGAVVRNVLGIAEGEGVGA